MKTSRGAKAGVVAAFAALIFVGPPWVDEWDITENTENSGSGPAWNDADDGELQSAPAWVWEVPPRPEVVGTWSVYAVGAWSCCDEQGQEWEPVTTLTCVPDAELESGVPEAELTFWEVPVSRAYEQGDACPDP